MKELVINTWYLHDDSALVCYQGKSNGYGFDSKGEWIVQDGWTFEGFEVWKAVDIAYIKQKLLQYAKIHYLEMTKHAGIFNKYTLETYPFKRISYPKSFNFTVNGPLHISDDLTISAIYASGLIYARGRWSDKEAIVEDDEQCTITELSDEQKATIKAPIYEYALTKQDMDALAKDDKRIVILTDKTINKLRNIKGLKFTNKKLKQ